MTTRSTTLPRRHRSALASQRARAVTLWRQVLAALNDDTLDDAAREQMVARGAAQLAVRRTPEGQQPAPDEVMAVSFEEFALLLDVEQARAALAEIDHAHG
ncbi:hypothetical protein [Streptomyces sp. NPDC047981]|uniref:hypothetical protein n=1 Tax=Streptomyces sp. NPDC047981 TaxID=3154610 RepID=UPI003446259A